MQRKILFIINPTAGSGKASNTQSGIVEAMDKSGLEYDIKVTEQPGHATELAKCAAGRYDTVVAVGGDGTIKEVVKGIVFTDVKLGIIPAGTGNDAVKSLEIPKDFDEAIARIINGHETTVDVGYAGDSIFLNVLSIGFDAEVVKNTDKIKTHIRGSLAYYLGLVMAFAKYKMKSVGIKSNDGEFFGEVLLAAVGNGSYYGGGFRILPPADMSDGLLDVVIGKKMSKLAIVSIFIELLKGKHLDNKEKVIYFRTNRLTLIPDDYIELNIDGEITTLKEALEISIEREALKILV